MTFEQRIIEKLGDKDEYSLTPDERKEFCSMSFNDVFPKYAFAPEDERGMVGYWSRANDIAVIRDRDRFSWWFLSAPIQPKERPNDLRRVALLCNPEEEDIP